MAMLRSRMLGRGSITVAQAARPLPSAVGVKTVFTVPAGQRAIVRDMRFSTASTGVATGTIYVVATPSGASTGIYLWLIPITPGKTFSESGVDIVLDEGDKFEFSTPITTQYYVSGALLSINPPV